MSMIFCRRCGSYSAKGTTVCPRCQADLAASGHESFSGSAPSPVRVPSSAAATSIINAGTAGAVEYGGFGNRLLAMIIDSLLLAVVITVPTFLLFFFLGLGAGLGAQRAAGLGSVLLVLGVFVALALLPMVYDVVMISKKGATYGKAFRKLSVVRTNGEPVSLGRALVRTLVKSFLSGILLIGYLMPLFTAKKQALHDLLADTIVVRSGN